MKRVTISVLICCLIFLYHPLIKAEVMLEPQTSVPADKNVESQSSSQTGTATAAPSKGSSQTGTATPSQNYDIQGVKEYKIQKRAEPLETAAEVKPQDQEVESEEPFTIDEYIENVKGKFEDFDITHDVLDKLKGEEGYYGLHTIPNWFETFDELWDEFAPKRSVFSIGLRPNGHLFRKARFACSGDYQANGVYFSERDLNAADGSQKAYSTSEEGFRREMTDEIEAFLYHDLILNPRFEFAKGQITLHTQFKHGGYMWETAFPNYKYESPYFWGGHAQRTDLDTTKLSMTGLFLEVLCPVGALFLGKLPEDPAMGATGLGWGLPIPIPPSWGFAGVFGMFYGKIMEGMVWDADRKGWEGHGWNYLEVEDGDGYQDEDDLNVYGIGGGGTLLMDLPIIGGRAYGGGAFLKIDGGDESEVFSGLDINVVGVGGRYTNGSLVANGIAATVFGTAVTLTSDTYYGNLIDKMETLYDEAMEMMDVTESQYKMYEIFRNLPREMEIKPVYLLAGNASFDFGPLRPEGCIIYAQGTDDPWQMPMIVPGFVFQSKGNRVPGGMLKSYLLNEVERKYFSLIGPPAMSVLDTALGGFVDIFSTNIIAVKAGGTLKLTKWLSAYGQVIGAWRENVEYYKENYWEYFMMVKALRDMEWYYDDDGMRQMETDAVLQFRDEEYSEEEIDNFLGIEVSGKGTWHIKEGLDLSIIAAYFKPGGFYEDILTPKRYSAITARVSDIEGVVGFASDDEKIIWGPYEGSRFFDLTDAYSVQFQFVLKWDD